MNSIDCYRTRPPFDSRSVACDALVATGRTREAPAARKFALPYSLARPERSERQFRFDRDWLQVDCALSYGLVEYLRALDMLREHDWSPSRGIPHGGHQMSLNIAAGLGARPAPAVRWLSRWCEGRQRVHHYAGRAGHRL